MNQMTTGASNDFQRATDLARRMVTQWGMSDALGPMVYGEEEGEVFLGRSVTTHKSVSEATMQQVDTRITSYNVCYTKLLREPSIDYVVTKIPRFAFEKFPQANA